MASSEEPFLLVAAIDFGTTFSGYAFSFTSSDMEPKRHEKIRINKNWGASMGFQSHKAPTSVLTTTGGKFLAFGYEAEQNYTQALEETENDSGDEAETKKPDMLLFRHFKMMLHKPKKAVNLDCTIAAVDGTIRKAVDIFAHALRYLKNHMLNAIKLETGCFPADNEIRWVITVPAIWGEASKKFMREAAHVLKEEKGSLEAVKCDLTKEQEILSLFDQIKSKYGCVDVCVNNAGLAKEAPLLTGETEAWKNMFDVNVLALCICSREAIKLMRERKVDDGHIIHISRAQTCREGEGIYAATKFAVRAITEGHRVELKALKSNIRVSAISPGMVETEFLKRMIGEEDGKKLYSSLKCLQGEDIADALQYVLAAPPHVQVHDILMRPTKQVS